MYGLGVPPKPGVRLHRPRRGHRAEAREHEWPVGDLPQRVAPEIPDLATGLAQVVVDLLRVRRDIPVEVWTGRRCDVPVLAGQRVEVGRELVGQEEAGVEGVLQVHHDRVLARRADAGEAVRKVTRRERSPVRRALADRGPDQRDVEQQILGVDGLPVAPLVALLHRERDGLVAVAEDGLVRDAAGEVDPRRARPGEVVV